MNSAFTIIVPTYNEAENLSGLLGALRAVVHRERYELVIADDASSDGTARVADRLARELGLSLQVRTRNGRRSLALSVVEAARSARHDCVVVLDADLSHDVTQIPDLARAVTDGDADVAIASRYATGGAIGEWPVIRRALSTIGTIPARWITRVSDPLSGFFACRRELLLSERLRPRGYKILLELLGRNSSLRVAELPTRFRNRLRGESKLRLRQQLEYLVQLASLCLRAYSPAKERRTSVRKEGLHET